MGRYPISDKKVSNRSSSAFAKENNQTENFRKINNIKVFKEQDSIDTIPLGDDNSILDASFADDFMKILSNKHSENGSVKHETKEDTISRLTNSLINVSESEKNKYTEYIINTLDMQIFESKYKDILLKINSNKDLFIYYIQNNLQKGIISYTNGDHYEGEYIDEKKHGYGILTFKNLSKYEGNFKNNKQHGYGKLIQYDGETYIGDWKIGKINGTGTRYHSNGDKYIGQYVNNIRNGFGTYHFKNGDYYEGEWIDGKAARKGKFAYSNGDIYEGEFKDNQIWGKGVFTYSNGDVYKGNFINGLINGLGHFRNNKGDIYQGDFINGKRHGYGQYSGNDGINLSGYWNNDVYISKTYK